MKWYWWLIIVVIIILIIYFVVKNKNNSSGLFSGNESNRACYSTKCFKDCMSNKNGELDNVPTPEEAFSVCSNKCGCK